MKQLIPLTIAFLSLSIVTAQQPQKTWELSVPESGEKTYIARDHVTLKPGFSYTAVGTSKFTAKIDEYLLFPPASATYGNANGAAGSTPTSGGVVGAIPGQFAVSPAGAATYTNRWIHTTKKNTPENIGVFIFLSLYLSHRTHF